MFVLLFDSAGVCGHVAGIHGHVLRVFASLLFSLLPKAGETGWVATISGFLFWGVVYQTRPLPQYSSDICLSPCSGLGTSFWPFGSTTRSKYSRGICPRRFGI